MSAPKVADEVVKALKSGKYQFILVNFANPDMVGHTGILEAAVKAIETIDGCLKRIVDTVKEVGRNYACNSRPRKCRVHGRPADT